MKKYILAVMALVIAQAAYSQLPDYTGAFQRIGNNGYFRHIADIGVGIDFANFQKVNVENYANARVVSGEYATVIKGRIRYVTSVINTPAPILKAMNNALAPYRDAGHLFEFIFPYERGPYSKGYLLFVVYLNETWTSLDCAQGFYICTE